MTRPPLRTRLRALGMGLATLSGTARRGWFIPYRHAGSVAAPATYPEIEPLFAAAEPVFGAVIGQIEMHAAALEAIGRNVGARAPDAGGGGAPPGPRWGQGWFPRLDAAAAYALVRARAPARIVEVGSGHSTRFMARAAADGGLATRIVCIDPAPRADISALGVDHVAATVQSVSRAPFEALAAGDILFVDSSHVAMPGSDVDYLLNRIWPILPAGVLVHIHDILLPDGYPPAWEWRGYNEQTAVAPLLAGRAAGLVFSSHYATTRMADRLAGTVVARLPMMDVALETSLWIEKK